MWLQTLMWLHLLAEWGEKGRVAPRSACPPRPCLGPASPHRRLSDLSFALSSCLVSARLLLLIKLDLSTACLLVCWCASVCVPAEKLLPVQTVTPRGYKASVCLLRQADWLVVSRLLSTWRQ